MTQLPQGDDVEHANPPLDTINEESLTKIFGERYGELLEGVPQGEPTWVTNGGPEGGIFGTLDALSAQEASTVVAGTTAAAHAEHVRWALQLVNDYFDGREPTSDWSQSWLVKEVDDEAWDELRARVRETGERLLTNVRTLHRWGDEMSVNGALASYGHNAYHLGALRQLQKSVSRGGT